MKPTLKQKEFAKVYVETGNATEAAMQVYDVADRNTARAIGSENLAKPAVVGMVDSLTQTMREITSSALHKAIAQAEAEMLDPATESGDKKECRRFLLECSKVYAEQSQKPNGVNKIDKAIFNYPSR